MNKASRLSIIVAMIVVFSLFAGIMRAGAVENSEPVSNAGPDQSVDTLDIVTLDGSASSDPDGNLPLTYQWSQTGGAAVVLSDPTIVNPVFTAPADPDTLTFTLVVTDSLSLPDATADEVVITVNNQAPVSDAGIDQGVFTNTIVILNGSASIDPDGDLPLTYLWAQTAGNAVTLSDPTASNPTFTAPVLAGTFTFSLTVTDSRGAADATPDTVTITSSYETPPMVYLPFIIKQVPPAAFNKTSPANGAVDQSLTPTLTWGTTSPVTLFEYCYDNTNDNACSTWISNGTSTSVTLPTLTKNTTYYWQVRAWNGSDGPTYANGAISAFWSFTTIPLPDPFYKWGPTNGAVDQSITPLISWSSTTPLTRYEYCIDTTNDSACTAWISTGATPYVTLPALESNSTYYWQVRAWNGVIGPVYADGSATNFWSFKTQQVWSNLFTERFEGVFPGSWVLYSDQWYGGAYHEITNSISWGKNNCKKVAGSYSGRAIGGGSTGITYNCSYGYPNDYYSEMVYGPLNLSQAKDGLLAVKLWLDIEYDYDYWFWGVSLNHQQYYGRTYTGFSNGWITDTIDLKNVYTLGNITGQSQVWIMVSFESDNINDVPELGVWIDDLVLSVCNSTNSCSGTPGTLAITAIPAGLQVNNSSRVMRGQSVNTEAIILTPPTAPWSDLP